MSATEAQISEIFNSIQGEGLYIGERQIFVRFAGCNLSCQYCDTPQALDIPKTFKVESTAGKKDLKNFDNPVTLDQLLSFVGSYSKQKEVNHSVSLTGGEPLLQVDFLKQFIPELKKNEHLVYLDTNGVLPKHLEEVIDLVDIVAMDIKLPSATGLTSYLEDHRKCLEIAYVKEVFVKVVFTRDSKIKEIDDAAKMIAEIDEKIPLVLQPVSPHGPVKHRPTPDMLLAFHAVAKRSLKDVRVIPQTHKILGLL